jgi:hypothetical protein
MRDTERKHDAARDILFVSNRRFHMQQLLIMMVAALGLIGPLVSRKLKRILATPRALKLSRHLLVTLAQADRVAPALVEASARVGATRAHLKSQTRGSARLPRFSRAAFWRDRDVDMPRRASRQSLITQLSPE